MVTQLKGGEEAEAAILVIHDRQPAELLPLDELQGFIDRGVRADGDDLPLHDVAHLRGEIADEGRRLESELLQDEIDPLIRRAGSRGGDVLNPLRPF